MKTTVHILATVRRPELLPAAQLVFRTLRLGFPTANVCVWGNGLSDQVGRQLGVPYRNLPQTSHDCWIAGLLARATEPFWICDTDVVFWSKVEDWFGNNPDIIFAGRFEPEFDEEWTGTTHVARLHTALMWFNPANVRAAFRAWMARFPSPWRDTAHFPLVHQHFVPVRGGKPLFYDTCAGLYHASGGTAFDTVKDAAFEHLHCGTYADLVDAKSLADLKAVHAAVFENPENARGLKEAQDKYYQSRLCPTT